MSFKWLQDNNIEMYSTHKEGKSAVSETFITTLKTKIYKYINSILKNVYFDKLADIVNKHNNCKKQINSNLELKRYLKEKVINYM